MIDGNTAIQVSPVLSECEMKSFQDMFARIANTITQASELSTKFTDLSHKVDDLSHSLEVAQVRNSNLDEVLLRVRTERDELSLSLANTKAELGTVQRDFAATHETITTYESQINGLNQSLIDARKDRDDAQFQVLTLTEELDKVKAIIEKLYAALGISKPVDVLKSEPVDIVAGSDTSYLNKTYPTDPIERSEPVFVGEGDGFKAEHEYNLATPAKPVEYRKVYRGDWDFDQSRWLNEHDHTYYGFAYDSDDSKADWYIVPV